MVNKNKKKSNSIGSVKVYGIECIQRKHIELECKHQTIFNNEIYIKNQTTVCFERYTIELIKTSIRENIDSPWNDKYKICAKAYVNHEVSKYETDDCTTILAAEENLLEKEPLSKTIFDAFIVADIDEPAIINL